MTIANAPITVLDQSFPSSVYLINGESQSKGKSLIEMKSRTNTKPNLYQKKDQEFIITYTGKTEFG